MDFSRGFRFFLKGHIACSLATLLVPFLAPSLIEAKEVQLEEVLSLPPMSVQQIIGRYVDKRTAPSSALGASKLPHKNLKILRAGEDFQISSLLGQESMPAGILFKSLGDVDKLPEEQKMLAELSKTSREDDFIKSSVSESLKHGNTPSQQVLIRVQGEQKAVASKLLEIEQPSSSEEQLEVSEQLTGDIDATSEFLSSYLAGLGKNDDALAQDSVSQKGKRLVVHMHDGQAEVEPKEISGTVGDIFEVRVANKEKFSEAKLFVRNQDLLSWDSQARELRAEKKGRTEVFFSLGDKMLIIPIDIHAGEAKKLLSDLSAPRSMVGFESLEVLSAKSVRQNASLSEELKLTGNLDILPFTPFVRNDGEWKIKPVKSSSPYLVDLVPVEYDKIRIQLIDEQSILVNKELRPAAGVQLKIIGTQYSEVTNAKGMGSFINVPHGSRFFIETSDTSQYYAPSIVEVHSQNQKRASDQPIRIKLMQRSLLHHLRAIHGIEADPFQASLCGVAVGSDKNPLAGVNAFARYDANSGQEAIYFSETGFPGEAKVTGSDGRFCFLALDEGPIGIEFSQGQEYIGSVSVSVFAGKHLEHTFPVLDKLELKTHISSLPAAKDIDLLPPNDSDNHTMVDMANLLAVSDESLFLQLDFGYLAAVEPLNVHNGRSCYVNESPEFEYAYYCYEQSENENEHVTSLIPNGFIDTIFQKYNMSVVDPDLGRVLVEHGSMLGREHDSELVVIELIDSFGNTTENRVHISDKPTTRAVFLNLKPGSYTVIAKTSQGFWLDMDTVTVFSDTTSYLRTGSPVRYKNK
ncbi:MAG: hypothetical protein AB8G05_04550 [Oligoflexales bacterium]